MEQEETKKLATIVMEFFKANEMPKELHRKSDARANIR